MVDRKAELLAIQNLMRTEEGRSFMYNQLQYCKVFANTFDEDTNKHSYNAGLRVGGLHLESELKEAAPGEYLKMIEEAINE